MRRTTFFFFVFEVATTLCVAACGSDGGSSPTNDDSASDAARDATTETPNDAGADSTSDAPRDAGDAARDAETTDGTSDGTNDGDATSDAIGGGAAVWAKRFGDAQDQTLAAIDLDHLGDLELVGGYRGTLDFGGGASLPDLVSSSSGPDGFFAALDPSGGDAFAVRLGGTASISDEGLALAAGGFPARAYVVTSVDVVRAFDGSTVAWGEARSSIGAGAHPTGVAIDTKNDAVVVGDFEGTIDCGAGPLVSAGGKDVFVAKVSATGKTLWSKSFGDAADQTAVHAKVDVGDDSTIFAGDFAGTIDFGGGPLTKDPTSPSPTDVYVAKLAADGSREWEAQLAGDGVHTVTGVGLTSEGDVYVAGTLSGTLTYSYGSTHVLTSHGGTDAFLVRFTSSRDWDWGVALGGAGDERAVDVAADPAMATGEVVVLVRGSGTMELGGGPVSSAVADDTAIVKLGFDGHHDWARFVRSSDASLRAAFWSPDELFVAGSSHGTIDLGGDVLTSAGMNDLVVARLAP